MSVMFDAPPAAPSDRELIDAAIAAGMVRRIPRGISSFDPLTGQPKAITADTATPPIKIRRRRSSATEESDALLREMWNAGELSNTIAAALGVCQATVIQRRAKLGLPERGRGYQRRWCDPNAAKEFERQLRVMYRDGETRQAIATALGCCIGTVDNRVAALRLSRKRRRYGGKTSPLASYESLVREILATSGRTTLSTLRDALAQRGIAVSIGQVYWFLRSRGCERGAWRWNDRMSQPTLMASS